MSVTIPSPDRWKQVAVRLRVDAPGKVPSHLRPVTLKATDAKKPDSKPTTTVKVACPPAQRRRKGGTDCRVNCSCGEANRRRQRGKRALLLGGQHRRPQELVTCTAGAARAERVVPGAAAGEAVHGREGGGGPASPAAPALRAPARPKLSCLPPPPSPSPERDPGLWGDGIPWWFTTH